MAVKVHVTGGQGFLGRYVEDALGALAASGAPGASGDRFDVEITDVDTLDVTDLAATVERLGASRPDVVCHLAGLTGANASLRDPRRFFEVNCVGTLNVLEACRLAGVKGLVFLSSLTVHGQSREPVTEDSPLAPRHPYAGSKASAELAVQTYARCYGIRSAILRATLIAGEGQKEPNAITEFVETTLGGEDVEIYGDGAHQREWLHPADLGSAVRAAIVHVAGHEDLECETYIVSSGEPLSMAGLAEKVIAATGKGELHFRPVTRQAFSLCTATDKARRQLGWAPEVDVEEIIRRVIATS